MWQVAHNAAKDPNISAMQKLLLGVNAHINYDLVLTLVDMLEGEWDCHTKDMRNGRYAACLLEMGDTPEKSHFIKQVEDDALKTGRLICHKQTNSE